MGDVTREIALRHDSPEDLTPNRLKRKFECNIRMNTECRLQERPANYVVEHLAYGKEMENGTLYKITSLREFVLSTGVPIDKWQQFSDEVLQGFFQPILISKYVSFGHVVLSIASENDYYSFRTLFERCKRGEDLCTRLPGYLKKNHQKTMEIIVDFYSEYEKIQAGHVLDALRTMKSSTEQRLIMYYMFSPEKAANLMIKFGCEPNFHIYVKKSQTRFQEKPEKFEEAYMKYNKKHPIVVDESSASISEDSSSSSTLSTLSPSSSSSSSNYISHLANSLSSLSLSPVQNPPTPKLPFVSTRRRLRNGK